MAFDPISWGLGFGSTKLANSLIEKTYTNNLPRRLMATTSEWAEKLPGELHTAPEAIFDTDEYPEFQGEARTKLQAILYMHTSIPSEEVWYKALLESWYEKKRRLGDSANGFFTQNKNSAQPHIRKLAKALHLECRKDPSLFQITALSNLATLADKSEEIKSDLKQTRSMIIDRFNRIESLHKARFPPVNLDNFFKTGTEHLNWESLSGLNKVLMVDKPTSVIAGKLRAHQSWIGEANSPIEDATYIPPLGRNLKTGLQTFLSKWSDRATPMNSNDPSEIVAGIAAFHHEILALHPFEDGNGSVARAMSDSHARSYFPFDDRLCLIENDNYMSSLNAADSGNLDPLIQIIDHRVFD